MFKLSAVQKRVLAEITWDARASVEDVARRLSVRPHTVRYAIDQLHSALRLNPFCLTDPFRRGQTPYRFFFSINSADQVRRKKMIEYLKSLPEVHWLYELYGQYQFLLSLRTTSMSHLSVVLKDFDAKFGDLVTTRSVSMMPRVTAFVPWLAHSGSGPRMTFEYSDDAAPVELDATDQKIIALVSAKPLASLRELARVCGIPASTLDYRLDKLVKSRVIVGFFYGYESRLTSGASFLVLVKFHGLGGGMYERFVQFGRNDPRVSRLSRFIGEWDMEMEVVLDDLHDIKDMVHSLHKVGGGVVREIVTHSFGEELKG